VPAAPKVFISYSHDSDAHKARVLALADRLRNAGGVEAIIDRYVEPFPGEGWPAWCWRQIEEADFVVMVCTEVYHLRVTNKEEAGKGHGVCWEAPIIFQLLYDQGSVSKRFVPVLFADGSQDHVPTA
jgi:SEFIR domain